MARLRAGVYKDKGAHPEFARVVLVTAANSAYWAFFQNWRCRAEQFGLDYAVVANDDEAFSNLGQDRALPVIGHKVSDMVGWGNVKLDYIGWNKMMNTWLILKLTGLDVVFTDCDNVFLRDPFQPGISLGDLIRAQKYDYLYSCELSKRPVDSWKSNGDGGNTGFFFASGSRKPKHIQALFGAVISKGMNKIFERGSGADQPIFWDLFNDMRKSKTGGPWGFLCTRLCDRPATCTASDADTIDYCPLSPFNHTTGWEDPEKYIESIVTYHANYATNKDKIKKLQRVNMWGLWDEKSGQCVHGSFGPKR